MVTKQRTIRNKVSITGITLHKGDNTNIVLSPSYADKGIVFYFTVNKNHKMLTLSAKDVIQTKLSTNIEGISTIEHLMSVLHVLGIDNLNITVNGSEIPILDGSAIQYWNLLKSAGIQELHKTKGFITIDKEIMVKEGKSFINYKPYEGFVVDMTIKFKHPLIGEQRRIFDINKNDYEKEIASAKTFGILKDIQKAKENGLLKGGSLENAIVLDHKEVINPPLRFKDEFVRHKILDFIGDMYLSGPIKGYFTVCCSGHSMNNRLLRKLLNEDI
jgi:UDP-3-O-[3-hydroxymyristoyl] N-acetylglucosamine deacetylase